MAHMNDQVREEGRRDERIRPPCFCKTVSEYCLEGGPSCWMHVPPEFVRNHLPHVDRMRTLLQNAAGETWPVQFVSEHGFVTGWAEFATGNALAIGDTLLFSFVEECKYFIVQVFGMSGCEKGTQLPGMARPPFRPEHDPKLRPSPFSGGAKRPLPQAGPRDEVTAIEKRGIPVWRYSPSQLQARALVTKARLRKMNVTLPRPRKHQQHKKQKPSSGPESDGEIGLDAGSGYHGERVGQSSLDSHGKDDKEATVDLAPLRMSGRRCMFPQVPPQANSSDAGIVVTEKRKRGRPFKHHARGLPNHTYPSRDIFVSRRRKVTQAECELALNSAYQLASRLNDYTTCVVVMRHSYVYRNFVLYVPRPFANRYMPDTNRDVAMVDSASNAWFGAWNASHKYISGGWRNFALEHCLEENDAVVIEILEDHPHALTLKVHLFPVVPVPEGLTGWHSHVCPPNYSYCEPNSTGVPIDPLPRLGGRIPPRPQRPRKRRVARKRVHSDSEDSFTTSDSSYAFD